MFIDLLKPILFWGFVVLLIVGSLFHISKESAKCEKLGGTYIVRDSGQNICIKRDGVINL